MESLTKENFWNEMEQTYPKAMAHFGEWIDQYKSKNSWYTLFGFDGDNSHNIPKYHELPIAMQFGIFLEYIESIRSIIYVQSVGISNPKHTIDYQLRKLERSLP